MRTVLNVLGGIAAGFVLAHLVNSTEAGRRFFEGVHERADEFADAVRDGYNARTHELITAISTRGAE